MSGLHRDLLACPVLRLAVEEMARRPGGAPPVISLLSEDEEEECHSEGTIDESLETTAGGTTSVLASGAVASTATGAIAAAAGDSRRGSTSHRRLAAGGDARCNDGGGGSGSGGGGVVALKHSLFSTSAEDASGGRASPSAESAEPDWQDMSSSSGSPRQGRSTFSLSMRGGEVVSRRGSGSPSSRGGEDAPRNGDSEGPQRAQPSNDASEEASTVLEDPLFRADKVLSSIEMELAWLGEESRHCLVVPTFNFAFVWEYASEGLRVELRKVVLQDESNANRDDWYHDVIRDDWLVRRRFEIVRDKIRSSLRKGQRRPVMARVIADIRLRQRKLSASERSFPPIATLMETQVPVPAEEQRESTSPGGEKSP